MVLTLIPNRKVRKSSSNVMIGKAPVNHSWPEPVVYIFNTNGKIRSGQPTERRIGRIHISKRYYTVCINIMVQFRFTILHHNSNGIYQCYILFGLDQII